MVFKRAREVEVSLCSLPWEKVKQQARFDRETHLQTKEPRCALPR
jgi:hypothetical protein